VATRLQAQDAHARVVARAAPSFNANRAARSAPQVAEDAARLGRELARGLELQVAPVGAGRVGVAREALVGAAQEELRAARPRVEPGSGLQRLGGPPPPVPPGVG